MKFNQGDAIGIFDKQIKDLLKLLSYFRKSHPTCKWTPPKTELKYAKEIDSYFLETSYPATCKTCDKRIDYTNVEEVEWRMVPEI